MLNSRLNKLYKMAQNTSDYIPEIFDIVNHVFYKDMISFILFCHGNTLIVSNNFDFKYKQNNFKKYEVVSC
jgi:hypothetical protein